MALLQTLDLSVDLGGHPVATGLISYQARFTPDNGSDQVGPFGGFDPAAPALTLTAGSSVAITMSSSQATLTGADVQIWLRTDVVGADGTLKPNPGDRIEGKHLDATGGTATWTTPVAGNYVISIGPAWSQACVDGSSLGYTSVKVL